MNRQSAVNFDEWWRSLHGDAPAAGSVAIVYAAAKTAWAAAVERAAEFVELFDPGGGRSLFAHVGRRLREGVIR